MYRITGQYPMVVSVGRGPIPVLTGPADGRAGCSRPAATPYRAVVAAAGDHWVPSRITSTAIALVGGSATSWHGSGGRRVIQPLSGQLRCSWQRTSVLGFGTKRLAGVSAG